MTTITQTADTEIIEGEVVFDSGAVETLNSWATAFAAWKKKVNNGSKKTGRAYVVAWRAFWQFLATEYQTGETIFDDDNQADDTVEIVVYSGDTRPDMPFFDEIDADDVERYVAHLQTVNSKRTGRPYSQSTINQHLAALTSFFDFVVERGLRDDNPAKGVGRKTVTPYGKAKWLSAAKDEDLQLLDAINVSTCRGLRDYVIVLFMMNRGLRVFEVAQLTAGNIVLNGEDVFVNIDRKGGKNAEIKLPEALVEALAAYLSECGRSLEGLAEEDHVAPLFMAYDKGREAARQLHGPDHTFDRLSTRSIRWMVKSYATKAFGKNHGITPHSLRHTAAQTLKDEGVPIPDIGKFLGHSDPKTTLIYIQATDKAGDKAADKLSSRYAGRKLGSQ